MVGARAARRPVSGPFPLLPLIAAWGLAASAGAQPLPVGDGADSLRTDDLPPEVVEVIEELDALDQPLALREIEAVVPAPVTRGSGWGSGRWRWRSASLTSGPRHDGRLSLVADRLSGRGALRVRPGEPPTGAGGGHLRWGPWKLWAGHLTLRHGFGLVAADPARRVSLAADQGLGGVSGGIAVRTSVGSGFQGGLEIGKGSWRVASVWAPPQAGGSAAAALRLARAGRSGEWAFFARRDTTGVSVSWSGRRLGPAVSVLWEVAGHRPPSGSGGVAAVAGMAWHPVPGFKMEVQTGATQGPWSGPASVLPAGGRRGWALRVGWRERGHGTLEVLVQDARLWPDLTPPRRRSLRVVDALWERRAGPAVLVSLRARHVAREESTWSEQMPWLPALAAPMPSRTLLSGSVTCEGTSGRVTGQWRSFAVDAPDPGGARQLLSLGGRRNLNRRLAGWCELSAAWGDPVDLVRGLSPLPGLVVARHWGRWQSEAMAGMSFGGGAWNLSLAVARRLPDVVAGSGSPGEPAALEGWLEVSGSW